MSTFTLVQVLFIVSVATFNDSSLVLHHCNFGPRDENQIIRTFSRKQETGKPELNNGFRSK